MKVEIDDDTPRDLAAQLSLQSVCWPNDDETYDPLPSSDWIFARSNAISRTADITGAHVSIAGNSVVREGVTIRGDLAYVS